MPTIAAYPVPGNGGARPTQTLDLPAQSPVSMTVYQDGGVDVNLPVDVVTLRWEISYTGLTPAETAAHDGHAALAKTSDDAVSYNSFPFTHPDTGVTHTGVRYERGGYKALSHPKRWAQARTVVLVKFPA